METCKLIILDQVNIKWDGLDALTRRKIVEKLKFLIPTARHTPQFKLGRWDGKVAFATVGGQSYFNVLDRIFPIVEEAGYDIDIDDRRPEFNFTFPEMTLDFLAATRWPEGHPMEGEPIMLREHQVEAINRYLENPQSLQSISTSAGKTIITGCLSKAIEPYGRSLVIVPGKDLVLQTCKDYINIGLDTGRYFGDFKEPDHKHTIATWQSLSALKKNNPEMLARILDGCVCVMVDEAHSIKGAELKEMLTGPMAHIPLRWGLTGTIPKDDFEFLSLLCSIGPKVGEIRADELQEKGILSNCHIHIQQTVDEVDYATYDAEKQYLATDRKRVAWIAEHCRKIAETGNTLVLVNSIELGKAIEEILGVPFIYGGVKTSKRATEYAGINYTDNQLLVATFGVASTGINIPRIFNLILIEPGKSFVRVIQSIGRGLRTAKDKDFVDIYDICSTAKFSKRHLTKRKEYYKDANYQFKVEKLKYR
jgi:superfamily II DNA or RNA helicase